MRHIVLIAMLCSSPTFGKKRPKEAPVVYSNVREIPASCDAVWGRVVPTIAKHGFMPESSDKAGGFMKLRYTRGNTTGMLAPEKDVKALTLHKRGALETFDGFRIASGALSLVTAGEKCTATVQFEYQVFRGWGNLQEGWFALPSNNSLESRLLDELEAATK